MGQLLLIFVGALSFTLAHVGLQRVRTGTADPVLAIFSGLAFGAGWAVLLLWQGRASSRRRVPVSNVAVPRWPALIRQLFGMGGGSTSYRFHHLRAAGWQDAMHLAQEEAGRLNHNYIGTEHLLLGLLHGRSSLGTNVLGDQEIDVEKVRGAVEFLFGRGESGMTRRAKKVVERSVEQARRRGQTFPGADHLLLGLLQDEESIAAAILESLGVDLDVARQAVTRRVGGLSEETSG